MFNCGDCAFKTKKKGAFEKHFKDNHSQRTVHDIDSIETVVEEEENVSELKAELKLLKSNFQRLEQMYHESLDEVNTVKSEYEAKIVSAHDKFAQLKLRMRLSKRKLMYYSSWEGAILICMKQKRKKNQTTTVMLKKKMK